MMFTYKIFKLTILLLIISSTVLVAQTNHQKLFEKAKFTMETKGDLLNAIEQFEEIIQQYPDEIVLGAKSQYFIGICYHKMGMTKAKKAFREVIDNYPTVTEIVSLAKEKLSSIQTISSKPVVGQKDFQLKQVWANPFDNMGSPSPDGRYMSYVNWSVPCLAVYEFKTGESKNITTTIGTWDKSSIWPETSIWSPDGKKLAYVWYGEEGVSIRTVGINSSEPEIILNESWSNYAQPYSWSADGNFILAVLCHEEEGHEIVMISVNDRSVQSLKKLMGGSHPSVSLSPDGRYVAYSFTPDLDSPQTDIYTMDVVSGDIQTLITHPKTDFNPLWMPDGKHIIFFSDRTGTVGVWSQEVSEGMAQGEEKFIKNFNRLYPKSIVQNGDLFMTFLEGGNDIYLTKIDPQTGNLINDPKMVVESNVGWNQGATFSPDGKSMAYMSQRGVLNTNVSWGQQSLIIRDLKSNKERELIPRLKMILAGHLTPVQWSPNGDEILCTGRDEVGHNGAFIVDLDDASFFSLLNNEPFVGGNVIWSETNTKLYYRIYGIPEKNGLYEIDRSSNTQTRILEENNIQQLTLHPEGQLLAIVNAVDNVIKLFDLQTRDLTELIQFKEGFKFTTMTWSPDGEWLYYTAAYDNKTSELWRIDQKGKQKQLIEASLPLIKHLRFHPDGKRISFTMGERSYESSLWIMKNYLPTQNKSY